MRYEPTKAAAPHLGKLIIAGTRVPVEAVVRQFAAGADLAWVLKGFPDLGEDDARSAGICG
jgi:uncharacterized protein (DUF433 family)